MAELGPLQTLYLEKAVQSAYVKVNEEGTEAAAATGGFGMELVSSPAVFIADHPFLFLIQDNESGTILFIGRISDPS